MQGPEQEPVILHEDYWGGHGPEDECPQIIIEKEIQPNRKQIIEVIDSARKHLDLFVKTSSREPIRSIAPGEQFDVEHFPEGTIIRLASEGLTVFEGNPVYNQTELWGVVSGYNYEGGRVHRLGVFLVADSSKGYNPNGGVSLSSSIRADEALHRKELYQGKYLVNKFGRHSDVRLYSIGKGNKEPRKSKLSSFADIFRRNPARQPT